MCAAMQAEQLKDTLDKTAEALEKHRMQSAIDAEVRAAMSFAGHTMRLRVCETDVYGARPYQDSLQRTLRKGLQQRQNRANTILQRRRLTQPS